nr:hypothetical protein [Comamonas testosteroni]
MRKTLVAVAAATTILMSACGGGGDNSSSDNVSNNQTTSTAPTTSSEAAAICSGTARASTAYDVFLPSANGIIQSSASRHVQLYGQTSDNSQCISIAASTAQADSSPGTIQVVTADNWNNVISYFDPVGVSTPGGVKLDQGLFITCTNGSDVVKHLGILNPMGTGSTFVGSNQIATVVKNTALLSYECNLDSSNNTTAGRSNTAVSFSSDGSIAISDGSNGITNISAADAPSLFTSTGYNLNGKILHWYLYQLPTGAGSKQVIVHTSQKTDGSYNIDTFLTP